MEASSELLCTGGGNKSSGSMLSPREVLAGESPMAIGGGSGTRIKPKRRNGKGLMPASGGTDGPSTTAEGRGTASKKPKMRKTQCAPLTLDDLLAEKAEMEARGRARHVMSAAAEEGPTVTDRVMDRSDSCLALAVDTGELLQNALDGDLQKLDQSCQKMEELFQGTANHGAILGQGGTIYSQHLDEVLHQHDQFGAVNSSSGQGGVPEQGHGGSGVWGETLSLLRAGLLYSALQHRIAEGGSSNLAAVQKAVGALWEEVTLPAGQLDDTANGDTLRGEACDVLCQVVEMHGDMLNGQLEGGREPGTSEGGFSESSQESCSFTYWQFHRALRRSGYCSALLSFDLLLAGVPTTQNGAKQEFGPGAAGGQGIEDTAKVLDALQSSCPCCCPRSADSAHPSGQQSAAGSKQGGVPLSLAGTQVLPVQDCSPGEKSASTSRDLSALNRTLRVFLALAQPTHAGQATTLSVLSGARCWMGRHWEQTFSRPGPHRDAPQDTWWLGRWHWHEREAVAFCLHQLRLLLVPQSHLLPLAPLLHGAVCALLTALHALPSQSSTGLASFLPPLLCSCFPAVGGAQGALSHSIASGGGSGWAERRQLVLPGVELIFQLHFLVPSSTSSSSSSYWNPRHLQRNCALVLLAILMASDDAPLGLRRDEKSGLLLQKPVQEAWSRVDEASKKGADWDFVKRLLCTFHEAFQAVVRTPRKTKAEDGQTADPCAPSKANSRPFFNGDLEATFHCMLLFDICCSPDPNSDAHDPNSDAHEAETSEVELECRRLFLQWLTKAAHLPTSDPRPHAPLLRHWASYLTFRRQHSEKASFNASQG